VEILKQLHEAVCRRMPEFWPSDWILHHGIVPSHKVLPIKQFLAQILITEVEHQPHSPYLALNDFTLFPEIKSALTGWRFQDTEDI
jgi:hypothetical protein